MDRKIKKRRAMQRRRLYGGALKENDISAIHLLGPGENNLNAINLMGPGENNLNAIRQIERETRPRPLPRPLPRPVLRPSLRQTTLPLVRKSIEARSLLQRAHDFIKKHKLVSRGTRAVGLHGISRVAEQAGYGRRKRRPGRPRKVRRSRRY